jgi:ArsR family metal-binding transcriptional regulator
MTVTTFARSNELEKARRALDDLGLSYRCISPEPSYARVGAPALAMDEKTRIALAHRDNEFVCSGWVEYRPAEIGIPDAPPPDYEEDIFGRAAIMVLAACVADPKKIRLIAHISGDLTDVFPYLNAEMQQGCYNHHVATFTFMDAHRMVSLYPRRIAIAKADEIVDAWRTLETIRRQVNGTWARRASITPSYEMREKPPALEIFKRLPRTNCGDCGELTCLAFAVKVWHGSALPSECRAVSGGEFGHLKDALLEICKGLGVSL